MKRILFILPVLIILLSFTSCSGGDSLKSINLSDIQYKQSVHHAKGSTHYFLVDKYGQEWEIDHTFYDHIIIKEK